MHITWKDLQENIQEGNIDLNSRIVVYDPMTDQERFCDLCWIKEDGFDRPVLAIKMEVIDEQSTHVGW